MMNLSKLERKMLIKKHLNEGYTYQEAYDIVGQDLQAVKDVTKKNREKKIVEKNKNKDFNDEFKRMAEG